MPGSKKIITICVILALLVIPAYLVARAIMNSSVQKQATGAVMVKEDVADQEYVKKLLADKDPESGKPRIIEEWNRVWGDLWLHEAKDMKARGLKEQAIIVKLNPVAAERVAKKLGIKKAEYAQQAVDAYFNSQSKK